MDEPLSLMLGSPGGVEVLLQETLGGLDGIRGGRRDPRLDGVKGGDLGCLGATGCFQEAGTMGVLS